MEKFGYAEQLIMQLDKASMRQYRGVWVKTVRQLANELGLSKQAVRKQVAKLPSEMVSVGSNRAIIINADGVRLLKKQVSTKYQPSANQVSTSINRENASILGGIAEQVSTTGINQYQPSDNQVSTINIVIDMLQQELDGKNTLIGNQIHQLENKDRQIAELTPIEATRSILNTYRGRPYSLCITELTETLEECGNKFFQ